MVQRPNCVSYMTKQAAIYGVRIFSPLGYLIGIVVLSQSRQ